MTDPHSFDPHSFDPHSFDPHGFDPHGFDPRREGDRLPRADAAQGIDHWAEHGVDEMAARDAAERAELGEPDPRRSET